MEEREILLRLRRRYSKSEDIKAMEYELGVLKSEISEERYKVSCLLMENNNLKQKYDRLHTSMMLIKRYFKVKFKPLRIIPKKINDNNLQ